MIPIHYTQLEPGKNYFVEYRKNNYGQPPKRFIGLGFIGTNTFSEEFAEAKRNNFEGNDDYLYNSLTFAEAKDIQDALRENDIQIVQLDDNSNLYNVYIPKMDFYFERIITARSGITRDETQFVDRPVKTDDDGTPQPPCFEGFYPLSHNEPNTISFYKISPTAAEKMQTDYHYIIQTASNASNGYGGVQKFEDAVPPIPRHEYNRAMSMLPPPPHEGKNKGGSTRRKIVKKKTIRRRKIVKKKTIRRRKHRTRNHK